MQTEKAWGTWEELVLGGAVLRHGSAAWTAVAAELRQRTRFPHLFSAQECKAKFTEVQERYSGSSETWFEELRKQRVAELKRELEKSENSIGSLQTKIASLSTDGNENDIVSSSSKEYQSKNRETGSEFPKCIKEEDKSANSSMWCWGLQKKRKRRENKRRESGTVSDANLRRESSMGFDADLRRESDVGSEANLRSEKDIDSEADLKKEKDMDSDANLKRESGTVSHATLRRESGTGSEANLRRESGTVSEANSRREKHTDSEEILRGESCTDSEANSSSCEASVNKMEGDFENSLDLEGVFKIIWENKDCSVFKRRLESQKKITYKKMIRKHIDLQIVASKINKGLISSPKELLRDLLLIAINALVYYPKDSKEYKSAIILRGLANKTLKKCLISNFESLLSRNSSFSEVNMEIGGVVKENANSENEGVLKKKVGEKEGVIKKKVNSKNEGSIKKNANNENERVIKKKVDSENEGVKKKKVDSENEGVKTKKVDSENEGVKKKKMARGNEVKKKVNNENERVIKKKVGSENEGVKKKKTESENEEVKKKKTNSENEGVKKKDTNSETDGVKKKKANSENEGVRKKNVNNEKEGTIVKKGRRLVKGGRVISKGNIRTRR